MVKIRKKRTRNLMARFPLSYSFATPGADYSSGLSRTNRPPTTRDFDNFFIGHTWIDTSPWPGANPDVYMLVAKDNKTATWINFSAGGGAGIETLTGSSGTAVNPTVTGTIHVTSAINGLTVDEDTINHKLILTSSSGYPLFQSLRGDNSIQVPPTVGGYIDILGGTGITVTENVGGNKLTVALSGSGFATQFITDNGTAIPAASVLNILSGENTNTSGAGNTVRTHLDRSIRLPDTNAVGTEGIYYLGATCDGTSCVNGARFIHNYGTNNTFIGEDAGNLTLAIVNAVNNTVIGAGGGIALVDGDSNIFAGVDSGSNCTNCEGCTFIGHDGFAGTTGVNLGCKNQVVLASGNGAVILHNYPGSGLPCTVNHGNTFVGLGAGNFTMVLPGAQAGNNAFGTSALHSIFSGHNNSTVGSNSLGLLTTGLGNSALGHECGLSNAAGTGLVSGNHNVLLGYTAGSAYTGAESNNVMLMSDGVNGESNTLRLGTNGGGTGQQNRCFVAGVRGITTTAADAIPVLISSTHQLGTISSSIRFKENVKNLGEESELLYKLRPVTFNYKTDETKSKQYGLIAEEVLEYFPRLVVNDDKGEILTVKYNELPAIMLNEMIKQYDTIKNLRTRMRILEEQISLLLEKLTKVDL